MINYDTLITFCIAAFALAISPGPDNIYVLLQSLVYGSRYGIATAIGLVLGCLVHTTLVAFGVSALIKQNELLFFAVKLLGALYLLNIAYNVYKSSETIRLDTQTVAKKTEWQLVKQGFIMNVLNPKVSLFFLSFFPGFLFSNTIGEVQQFYSLGILFMLSAFIVFSIIALLSGKISMYIKSHKNIGKVFKWLQIIVFVGIAIFVLM